MKIDVKFVTKAAIIAVAYAVLTILLTPISYGVMQVRVSEVLTILPIFTPAAVPGLFVGCLIANLMSPYGVLDIIFGSLATLIGAWGTYKLRNKKMLAPLAPVLANGFIVGTLLRYVSGVEVPLWACILFVALGEAIACYGIGYFLIKYFDKHREIFNK